MKTDNLFYRLFADRPDLVFELLGESSPRFTGYEFDSVEVKQLSFRIDGVLVPPSRAVDLPIVFVEVMGYRDQKKVLYSSLFAEIFLYLHDYQPQHDWRAVVIFTERRFDPNLSPRYREFENNPRLQRIYLDQLPDDVAGKSIELEILQLIGIKESLATDRAKQLIDRTRTEVTDVATTRSILELITTVFVYKFPTLTREEIELMLGIDSLKQTRFYQEAQQEGREEGLEAGRQQMLSRTVPVLLQAGLSIEQISQQLQVGIEAVRQAAEPSQN